MSEKPPGIVDLHAERRKRKGEEEVVRAVPEVTDAFNAKLPPVEAEPLTPEGALAFAEQLVALSETNKIKEYLFLGIDSEDKEQVAAVTLQFEENLRASREALKGAPEEVLFVFLKEYKEQRRQESLEALPNVIAAAERYIELKK